MKVLTVVGARPQFIKAFPVSIALHAASHTEYLTHTGQHYDYSMSQIFFDELGISPPDVNLGIGSGSHGAQTGRMLEELEKIILQQQPDWVLVYGDTNSTLAGALAAVKLGVPLAHVEAGLRSFNRSMPEEHNRVLTDHCSDLLLCPTQTAVEHLAREGITKHVHLTGDTMIDALLRFAVQAEASSSILSKLSLRPKTYALATVHRPYNTDAPENMRGILSALAALDWPVVFPAHPRTRQKIAEIGYDTTQHAEQIKLVEPLGYLDMLCLQKNAALILTDSGGIQKEAYALAVPCVTLRPETEWSETVTSGWNVLAESNQTSILHTLRNHPYPQTQPAPIYGDGHAGEYIVMLLNANR